MVGPSVDDDDPLPPKYLAFDPKSRRIADVTFPSPGRGALLWLGLALASSVLVALLTWAAVPAAILIGPLLAAIAFGLGGAETRVARPVFLVAQGVAGCLVAGSITPAIVAEIVRDWHAMLLGAAITVGASGGVGLFLARFGNLPGSTAAWGTAPGAASAMVLLAQEFGADPRLVATMQYVRLITVIIAASLISGLLIDGPILPLAAPAGLSPTSIFAAALCLAIAVGGAWLGHRLRIPAGGMLLPLVFAAGLNVSGLARIAVPFWLLVASSALIGWAVGLQFDRGSLIRSVRALPVMLASAFAVIALCGLGAWAMMRIMGVSALTAFLATTPGGIDTVAIIALSGGADTPFVMAVHVFRLLVVIMLGPAIARWIARFAEPDRV